MTEKRANEILRTKYPEAELVKGQYFGGSCSGRVCVVFHPGGKVYDYRGCSTYQQILGRLGFTILYKHDVANMKRRIDVLNKKISDGGEENTLHLFDKRKWIPFTADEMDNMKREVAELEDTLANAIID